MDNENVAYGAPNAGLQLPPGMPASHLPGLSASLVWVRVIPLWSSLLPVHAIGGGSRCGWFLVPGFPSPVLGDTRNELGDRKSLSIHLSDMSNKIISMLLRRKKNTLHGYNGILFSHKPNPVIWNPREEPVRHYAGWNKPGTTLMTPHGNSTSKVRLTEAVSGYNVTIKRNSSGTNGTVGWLQLAIMQLIFPTS